MINDFSFQPKGLQPTEALKWKRGRLALPENRFQLVLRIEDQGEWIEVCQAELQFDAAIPAPDCVTGKRCFNAHIEKKKSKCDYHFDRPLTEDDIRKIEIRVNDIILSDMKVTEAYLDKKEAGDQYNLNKLPADAGNRVRIVEIGDYDACPCVGPHVASTGEIGPFRITSWDYKKGILRIRFKIGSPPP